MALSSRFATRSSSLLRQVRVPASPTRTFTTRASTRCLYAKSTVPAGKSGRYVRLFSSSALRQDQSQTAPNAEAYIQSGVIKGAKNPVDVKKVSSHSHSFYLPPFRLHLPSGSIFPSTPSTSKHPSEYNLWTGSTLASGYLEHVVLSRCSFYNTTARLLALSLPPVHASYSISPNLKEVI
jgi:hypothetical protein